MAHTYEFVIAAVKDDDGAVNSDGLCPRLPESGPISIASMGIVFYITCCTRLLAVRS
jgi:hypothetical protein